MIRMECFKKIATFEKSAKNPLLGQKMHFLGLRKWPKTTVYSEVLSNLKKNYPWDVCNQSCINFFSRLNTCIIIIICQSLVYHHYILPVTGVSSLYTVSHWCITIIYCQSLVYHHDYHLLIYYEFKHVQLLSFLQYFEQCGCA